MTSAPRLQTRFSKPNTVLILVVLNEGGMPIAVKSIVNPQLPLNYTMDDLDLILPGESWKKSMTVKVHVNVHGNVGQYKRGDLRGVHKGTVHSGDTHVNIVVDEEIGL